jgi:hypothetical protein
VTFLNNKIWQFLRKNSSKFGDFVWHTGFLFLALIGKVRPEKLTLVEIDQIWATGAFLTSN